MIRNVIASVPVSEIAAACDWYEQLLQRSPESVPMDSVAEWKFDGGGWLQVYEAPDRAGGGSFTLSVRDLRGEVSRLRDLGLAVEIVSESAPVRVALVDDLDGNKIALAETPDPTMAQ